MLLALLRISPLFLQDGKELAVEMTVSDMTLTAPHFVSMDFAFRPEIAPFVYGVCQIVSPSDA